MGDFSASALQKPTIVGTVLAEFGPVYDLGERDALTTQEREAHVKKLCGEEGGEKILTAYRKAFPGKNEVYAVDVDTCSSPAPWSM